MLMTVLSIELHHSFDDTTAASVWLLLAQNNQVFLIISSVFLVYLFFYKLNYISLNCSAIKAVFLLHKKFAFWTMWNIKWYMSFSSAYFSYYFEYLMYCVVFWS